jgi:hypothetical protein
MRARHRRRPSGPGAEPVAARRNRHQEAAEAAERGRQADRPSQIPTSGCKPRCCPKEPARKVPRSLFEGARDMARHIGQSDAGRTSRRQRKKVEILFAHLKRILRLDRLRLRGPNGDRDEFLLAATVQNLRRLAKPIPAPTPARTS